MKPLVIGIGEILWDLLPSGPRMGGAPANFACHARALGAESQVASRVGDDEPGAGLLRNLIDLGLPVSGISIDPTHATGSVGVKIMEDGQPAFTIEPDAAWDHLVSDPRLENVFAQADAVCFGTLAQRSAASAQTIRGLVSLTGPEALRVFDVNLRQNHYSSATIEASLELANVLKLNDAELPQIAAMLDIQGSVRECLTTLLDRYGLRLIAFTRGAEGSILYDGVEWCEHPGLAVNVSDTIGAGDSFTAAVTMGLLNRWPIGRISEAANEVATHVCSQAGAVPRLPDSILARFDVNGARHQAATT
ncbi:MAG: carbohydrate kinase [Luteolibacter sp.]|uniref:carbohydrate kinase family protein n=1 Tax=Luteolibacter sp. TaxID=1962973 RepID=UPI003266CEBD